MIGNELMHRRNTLLISLIIVFYVIQVVINITIEGFASIFPPAYLFIVFYTVLLLLLYKKVNPKITMYVMISSMYIYFYFLLKDSPYLVNYLFMLLALPFSAIYQNTRVISIAGIASIFLTFYSFFYLKEGTFLYIGEEDFLYLILFIVIVTTFLLVFIHKVQEVNDKFQELAYYDPLTGAANRLLLKDKFDLLKFTNIHSIGILFIDMNGFKKINDTYGHEIGDQLLKITVLRVKGVLRDTDLLCRLGGDEFVVLSYNIDNEILEKISKRIQLALEEPMTLNDKTIRVSASIGWYVTSDVLNPNLECLIKEADKAMYRVKEERLSKAVTPLSF